MSNNENRKKLSEEILESEKEWSVKIKILSSKLKGDVKDVVELQAETISYRQDIVEEIKLYSVRVWKLVSKMKVLAKARFEFYATSYQVKTSGTEKLKLIEADLSEHQQLINELDEHVNFLRDTSKNLDNINYGVKNKIELENILGGYK
jgi:hypothetical protein